MKIDHAEAKRRALDLTPSGVLAGTFTERLKVRQAIADAIEQAVRETAEECAIMLESRGVMLSIQPGETRHARCVRFAMAFALKIRATFGIEDGK